MRSLLVGVLLLAAPLAHAQGDLAAVTIKTQKLAEGLYALEGAGGNIGVSVGADGVMVIDDQFAELSPKIQAAIAKLSAKPIRFVVNTHWHGDHTGGNENLAKTGAVIVAHDNVRTRMSTKQFSKMRNAEIPPSPTGALPIVTFTTDVTFHMNGDDVTVFHPAEPAHTDGDGVVWFKKANVIHMGDTMMTWSFPFADVSSGGNFLGFIAVADRVLAMIDDKTKVIPGHGTVTNKAGLEKWRDMLVTIRDRVQKGIDAGQSLEQVQKSRPTKEFDKAWGQKFIKPDQIVEAAYTAIAGLKK